MFHIVLLHPQIPPNTGNVIRFCVNCGTSLHLVEPLSFNMDDASLRRAGLDYHSLVNMHIHQDWSACYAALGESRIFAVSRYGQTRYDRPRFVPGDAFVFGSEQGGFPPNFLESFPQHQQLVIPMRPQTRCLNLSNAVAVVAMEAWRQHEFAGALV